MFNISQVWSHERKIDRRWWKQLKHNRLGTNQWVSVAVDVYDASISVLDEINDSRDEVVDRQLFHPAEQWTQVVERLKRVAFDSPSLTKCAHQEPVEAPPRVQVAWSIQSVLAFGWIDKVKVRYFELESDTTFRRQLQSSPPPDFT